MGMFYYLREERTTQLWSPIPSGSNIILQAQQNVQNDPL